MSDSDFVWDDQRAFLTELDTGSLSATARALGLTQPTVRHRVEALKRAIGQSLFVRGVNGLAPTPEALGLAGHVRRMAHASDAFRREAEVGAFEIAGPVRLSVSDFVGTEVVPPMLAALRERHPCLTVELLLTNANTDPPGQEADVAVRMARPSQSSLVARHVGSIPLGFFASQAYLDRDGVPETVADLTRHAMVGPDRMPAYVAVLDALCREAGGPLYVALRSDSHPAQLAAVRVGLGIGVVQVPVGERDLVCVLPDRFVFDLDTWIVAHEDVRRIARIDALFDHLVESFQAYRYR